MSPRIILIAVYLFFLPSIAVPAEPVPPKEIEQLDFAHGLLDRGLYDMATEEYQKFIVAYPQSTSLEDANFGLAESYFLAQKFPQAIDSFQSFKKNYPSGKFFPMAVLRLSQIFIQTAYYEGASSELSSIDEAVLQPAQKQSFYFYKGKLARAQNNPDEALVNFKKALEIPEEVYKFHAWEEIGEIHKQAGRFDEAFEAFNQALQSTAEQNLQGYLTYKLGEISFLSKKYRQAIPYFRDVLLKFSDLPIVKEAFVNLLLADSNIGELGQAIEEYQKNVNIAKNENAFFDVHFTAVRVYEALGRFDEGFALLDKILSFSDIADQNKRKAMLQKGDMLIKQKKYRAGLDVIESPLPGEENDGDYVSFLQGQGYFGLNDFQRSYNSYKVVKNNFQQSFLIKAALLGMAHAAHGLKNYQEAFDLFIEYFNTETDAIKKSDALYFATLSASKLEDPQPAITRGREYLSTYPSGEHFEAVVLLLGEVFGKAKQFDQGIEFLKQYEANPEGIKNIAALQFLLGYTFQLAGRTDEAVAYYNKISAANDDKTLYAASLKNMAVMDLAQGKEEEAVALYNRVITELDKNHLDFKTYLWLCEQYLKEKKFEDVLRVADRAQTQFPNQEPEKTAYFKAESYRELKDCSNADKFYDIALASPEKNMFSGAAHLGKGLCLAEMKDLNKAKKEFESAIDENNDDHTITMRARFELGNVLGEQGKSEEALKYYLLAGTLYEDEFYSPEALLRAGKIFETLNQKEEALKMYQSLLDSFKDSQAVSAAEERIKALK